jgi:hypothetical protein
LSQALEYFVALSSSDSKIKLNMNISYGQRLLEITHLLVSRVHPSSARRRLQEEERWSSTPILIVKYMLRGKKSKSKI